MLSDTDVAARVQIRAKWYARRKQKNKGLLSVLAGGLFLLAAVTIFPYRYTAGTYAMPGGYGSLMVRDTGKGIYVAIGVGAALLVAALLCILNYRKKYKNKASRDFAHPADQAQSAEHH